VTSRISPARPFTAEISPGTAVSSLASWTPLSSCGFVENGAFPVFHSLHSSDDDSVYYQVSTKPGELHWHVKPQVPSPRVGGRSGFLERMAEGDKGLAAV
jgi:hypothetical protein